MVGFSELLFLVALTVVVFQFRRLPSLFGSLGGAVRAFKKGLNDEEERPIRDVEEIRR